MSRVGEQSQVVDGENGKKKEDEKDCIPEPLKKHPLRFLAALIVIIAFLVAVTLNAVSWTSEGDTRLNLEIHQLPTVF